MVPNKQVGLKKPQSLSIRGKMELKRKYGSISMAQVINDVHP